MPNLQVKTDPLHLRSFLQKTPSPTGNDRKKAQTAANIDISNSHQILHS